jgi:hypothetical protein
LNGTDITDQVPFEQLLPKLTKEYKRLGGSVGQALTAASAMTVISAALNNTGAEIHAPGPNGLIGAYLVKVNATNVSVVLPDDITLEETIEANRKCTQFDGIESMDDEGNVTFTDSSMQVMHNLLGYSHKIMKFTDIEIYAAELGSKYQSFAEQYKK